MDWSELNPDILRLIAKKLGDISNFFRFRVVCKHWRSAVGPSELPPQLPWFVDNRGDVSSEIEFYSLYSDKNHTIHVPEADGKHLLGLSKKHLFLKDFTCMTSIIVNSFTLSQIQVPYRLDPYLHVYVEHRLSHGLNPSENICAATIMFEYLPGGDKFFLCLCRSNDKVWTKVEVEMGFGDATTLYNGNLFIHDKVTTDTRVVDITTGDVVSVISGQGIQFRYLIEAFDDILGVVQLFNGIDPEMAIEECRFKVYRLDKGGKTPSWAEMSQGIGDRMLFMGYRGAFCLKASDFDGFKGNSIYFSKWSNGSSESSAYEFVCRYDLEENITQALKQMEQGCIGTWFVPSFC